MFSSKISEAATEKGLMEARNSGTKRKKTRKFRAHPGKLTCWTPKKIQTSIRWLSIRWLLGSIFFLQGVVYCTPSNAISPSQKRQLTPLLLAGTCTWAVGADGRISFEVHACGFMHFPCGKQQGGRAQHKQQTVFFFNSFPLCFIVFLDLSIQPTFFGDLFGACVVRHAVLIWADILPYHPLSSFQARVSCPTPDMGIQAPWMRGQGVCDMLQVNGKVYLQNWPKLLIEVVGRTGKEMDQHASSLKIFLDSCMASFFWGGCTQQSFLATYGDLGSRRLGIP